MDSVRSEGPLVCGFRYSLGFQLQEESSQQNVAEMRFRRRGFVRSPSYMFRNSSGGFVMHRATRLGALLTSLALVIQGCASTAQSGGSQGAAPASDGGGSSTGKTVTELVSGLLGATAGLAAAQALANSDAKRLKLSPSETEKRKRGYMIAFGLLGFAAGSALGGTVYSKLSEQGRRDREKALQAAAEQARQQHYGEPTQPSVIGTTTPGKRYVETAANRECVDVEDALADGTTKDAIFVKMCRSRPNGAWQQVTA